MLRISLVADRVSRYIQCMKPIQRAIAVTELALVFPAALFMTALFGRNLQPQQYEPARSAERIVAWYAAGPTSASG